MLRKTVIQPQEAAAIIKDGMTVMVGGFMCVGSPIKIIDAICESDVKDLTIICNDAGLPNQGVGKLIESGKVTKLIASHIGLNRAAGDKMSSGEMEVILTPQGTLIEQIRAGGTGLGAVITQTGVGTLVEDGKQTIELLGVTYLVEMPLKADVSILGATETDVYGNTFYAKTTKNFNPMMATAADIVLVEAGRISEVNESDPELFTTPSIFIDYIVE